MKKRIGLLLTLAAVAAALVALSAGTALANHGQAHGQGQGQLAPDCTRNGGEVTCVEKTTFTKIETTLVDTRTEVATVPTTQSCTPGNSNVQGTQQGNQVTTTEIKTFKVERVTFEQTTTTVFQGNPRTGQIVSGPTTSDPKEVKREEIRTFEEREVISSQFVATGPCSAAGGGGNPNK